MTPTKIAVYDFDGTLFRSPEKPESWAEGWWGNPVSLNPPVVPEAPGAGWWNASVVQRAKEDIANADVFAVLLTGRLAKKFTARVKDLLAHAGLKFNRLYLAPGGDTEAYKLRVLGELISEFPTITGMDIWEDRANHLAKFADFVESKGKAAFPHLITVSAQKPEGLPSAAKVASLYLASERVAARYKSKKKIQTKDGDEATVYEYSDRQVANRHREKAERVEHLRNHITDLRARVKDDLKSDDPMTRMTALAVTLMDHTCERVGNDDSADDGHYGVTGWKVEHVTFRGDRATIEYVGKSGVAHTKTVDDGPTVKALREVCKDRKKGDTIFDTDDAKVSADEVNDYLAEFDVTAKDIRGFRANDEMCKALRAERAKGPKDLPRSRKEKDEVLGEEFKRALETVAEIVGHTESILRSSYLVPGLEDAYTHDGTVIKSLKVGTKTEAQREDEATEKLVKPAPKVKPPRHDLRNERVEAESDPDLDDTDDDLSLNFKKVARRVLVAGMAERVASRYLWAKASARKKELEEEFLKSTEGQLYKTPKSDKKDGVSYSHLKKVDPEMARGVRQDWMESRQEKVQKERQKDQKGSEPSEAQKALKKPATPEQIEQSVEKIQGSEAAKSMPEAERDGLSGILSSVMSGQSIKGSKELEQSIYRHGATHVEKLKGGVDRKTVDALRKVPEGLYGKGVKMTTFDSKKSSDQIAKKQKSREKTKADYDQAKRSVKELPLEVAEAEDSIKAKTLDIAADTDRLKKLEKLTGAEDIRKFLISETDSESRKKQITETPDGRLRELNQSDITRLKSKVSTATRALEKLKSTKAEAQKKLEVSEKRLPSLEKAIERETSELNAMTAYHVSQEHLSSRLSDMSSLKSDSPNDRLSEAAKHLQAQPPEMRDKAIERSKARRDEKKKDLDNASSDEERAALQKEIDLADAELAAGTYDKYLRMSERDADEDPKASLFRSLNDRGIGVDDPHVQTLLHEKANQADAAKAVRNLATELSDEELSELSKKSSTLGHAYESLKGSPFLAQMLREMIVDEMVGEFQKGRAKGKSDKGKPQEAAKVKELAEAAKDLPEKDRETVQRVVRETATNLPAADRETVEDIVDLDIPDAATAPKGDQKEKGPSSPGEYRQMLLEGAGDEEARRKIKDLSSEELNERFEKYKAGKTSRLDPRRLATRFLSYSRRGR